MTSREIKTHRDTGYTLATRGRIAKVLMEHLPRRSTSAQPKLNVALVYQNNYSTLQNTESLVVVDEFAIYFTFKNKKFSEFSYAQHLF